MESSLKESVRRCALELGFDACQFTTAAPPATAPALDQWLQDGCHGDMEWLARNRHRRVDPRQVLPTARSLITLAASYHRPGTTPRPGTGVVARYARGPDYHDTLAQPLAVLTSFLESLDPAAGRSLAYVDTGPILERDLAARAGLGFVGKHTSLISRQLGNWFFLAEILTPLEFAPDDPEPNRCGSCTRCISACPTGAITAPFRLDARRCISYLTIELKGSIPVELRPAIGNRIFGCDDCLAVCPWNRFAREGNRLCTSQPAMEAPDLLELLALDDAGFRQRFDGTPLLRLKRRRLLRNVCVALGNSGNTGALPALEHARHDPEPLIAEHADWAVERLSG